MPTRPEKPWYRPRNVALMLLAVFVVWVFSEVFRGLNARPGGTINYGQKMVRLVESYQKDAPADDPDAWPILLDLIDRYAEVEAEYEPPPGADQPAIRYDLIFDPPRLDPDEDYDAIERKAFEDERIIAAQSLEALGVLAERGVFDLQQRIAQTRRGVRPAQPGHLIDWLLPELGPARNVARAGAARMYLAHKAGDDEDVVPAFEQTLALGRVIGSQSTLIDHLVGIAIISLATQELRSQIIERPPDADTLGELLAAMDRQLPLPPIALPLEGERLFVMDTIQWTHTDNGHGNGRLILSAARSFRSFSQTPPPMGGSWINIGSIAFASKKQTTRRANEFYDGVVGLSRLPPGQRARSGFDADSFINRLSYRYTLLKTMLPAISHAMQARDQMDLSVAGTRLMLGIELYRARTGDYPRSLDDLTRAILEELPTDPYAPDGRFGYRRLARDEDPLGRAYLLYSVGADGEDNDAATDESRPLKGIRSPDKGGLDFIINRPRQ